MFIEIEFMQKNASGFPKALQLIAISLIHDSKANAEHSPDRAITTVVTSYLQAIETGNLDAMVQNSDDLRFPDKVDQKKNYAGIKQTITNASVNSLEKITTTIYKANITATIDGNPQQFAIPVVYKYGKWLVIIGQAQPNQ
jgi:hypothetical protein